MTAINSLLTAPVRNPKPAPAAPASAAPRVQEAAVASDGQARPNYVSIYASSIFAIVMVFLLGVGFPAALAYGNATGWALGGFCAFWGGPSFGVMVGSARVSAWQEKHAAHG